MTSTLVEFVRISNYLQRNSLINKCRIKAELFNKIEPAMTSFMRTCVRKLMPDLICCDEMAVSSLCFCKSRTNWNGLVAQELYFSKLAISWCQISQQTVSASCNCLIIYMLDGLRPKCYMKAVL